MENTNQFQSQMGFLKTYADSFEQKKILLEDLKGRYEQLKPSLDEAEKIKEEIDDLANK